MRPPLPLVEAEETDCCSLWSLGAGPGRRKKGGWAEGAAIGGVETDEDGRADGKGGEDVVDGGVGVVFGGVRDEAAAAAAAAAVACAAAA